MTTTAFRESLMHTLASSASHYIAEEPTRAADIAYGIIQALNILAPHPNQIPQETDTQGDVQEEEDDVISVDLEPGDSITVYNDRHNPVTVFYQVADQVLAEEQGCFVEGFGCVGGACNG